MADGVFFSAMVGLGEAYVPAFALAIGLGEVVAGLVATLPMLAGAAFQLVTPWAVRQLGSYRRWVVASACLQALSFLPLIAGAALGRLPVYWLGMAAVAYWSFGMATGPAWNAWVTSLVPQRIRARFFASRTRSAQIAVLGGILAGGMLLQWGRGQGVELACYALLFAAAMTARLLSAGSLARQSEAPGLASGHRALQPREIVESIRTAHSGRVLVYLLGMQAAVNVAAPFFTPYMLGSLALSYAQFTTLTAAAFLARIAVLPLLGRLTQRRGTRAILWWGAAGITPLPALWLVSDAFLYLIVVQLLAGTAWAALELATLLTFFEGIKDTERASVLSAFNLGNAVAIAVGALLGSQLFSLLDGSASTYVWLFAISSLARLAILPVLRGTTPARAGLEMSLRTLAIRPSVGAIERPILGSVGEEGVDDGPGPRELASPPASLGDAR